MLFQSVFGPRGVVGRIGGEEFALILPHTSAQAARDVAARLLTRPLAVDVPFTGDRPPPRVTLSYGMVTYPEAGVDAFELYRKADAMLYLSKDLGRNQCHFWSSEGNHLQLKPEH